MSSLHKLSVILTLSLAVFAQEIAIIQEPERYGFFHYLDSSNNSVIILERQTPRTNVKKKAFGFGGANVSVEIKGAKSPVRFSHGQKVSFIVRMPAQDFDIAGTAPLIKSEVQKDKRVIDNTAIGRDGGRADSPFDPNPNSISYNTEKYGKESFKVTPAKVLEPGEYCFSGIGTADYFCFGVDPTESKK